MNFEEWAQSVPMEIRGDSLWKMEAYRLALFAVDVGWHDVTRLIKDGRTAGVADQLYRALGSTQANLAEGYSRSGARDRARFYAYALGSAREARGWYYSGRHILSETVCAQRFGLLTQIIRLVLVMVPDQRGTFLSEEPFVYSVADSGDRAPNELQGLLQTIPMS